MPRSFSGEVLDIPAHMRPGMQNHKNPMPYPNPFFDLSKFYYPPTVKELFKWCRFYFKTNGIVASIIHKMSEYPITDLTFEPAEDEMEEMGSKKLEKIITERLRTKEFMIEIGLDRNTYGTAIATIYFPFVRFFVCPKCEAANQFEDFSAFGSGKDLDFKNWKFTGVCPSCKTIVGEFKVVDVPVRQIDRVNLVRYNPENIDIEKNSITGQQKVYYHIPNKDRRKIMTKDVDTLRTMPWEFIQAAKDKKRVQLNNSLVYVFKRSDISDGDDEWGMPLIIPVMRDLFYLQVLRKAQEAIAMEHLVPLRVLYPADNQSDAAPHMQTGLGFWRKKVEEEINKWKRDPNYVPVMPVPLGYQQIGGQGKMLLLYQEIRQVYENIVNGMTVPQEFVFGGLSWSGSSVSLRMLENHFLVYRREMLGFLNFLADKMAKFLGVSPVKIGMQQFKMADDIQRKQIMMDLERMDKVSTTTMLKEVMSVDASAEVQQMIRDVMNRRNLDDLLARRNALSQAKLQGMQLEETAEAQRVVAKKQARGDSDLPPGDSIGTWAEVEEMVRNRNDYQDGLDDVQQMHADPAGGVSFDPEEMAIRYAAQLMEYDSETRKELLARMNAETPEIADLVLAKMREFQQAQSGAPAQAAGGQQEEAGGGVDMTPLPEQLPPRRSEDKGVI